MDLEPCADGAGQKIWGGSLKPGKRIARVRFVDEKLFAAYSQLKRGNFEEKELAASLEKAITDLKCDPLSGIKIPSRLWPKEYVRKYGIDNLRKYNLPRGWRVVYTIVGDEIEVISVLLEWFDHKDYGRRFGYQQR